MKETMETIRRYLQFWDPIGVIEDLIKNGLPPDEYDSYAGPIYTLLAEGGSIADLNKHFEKILEHMGMKPNLERDQVVAEGIYKYFNKTSGFRK